MRSVIAYLLFIVGVGVLINWSEYSANYVACRKAGGALDVCIVGAGGTR